MLLQGLVDCSLLILGWMIAIASLAVRGACRLARMLVPCAGLSAALLSDVV